VLAAFGKEIAKTNDLDPEFHKLLIAVQDYHSQGDYSFTSGVEEARTEGLQVKVRLLLQITK
jgi:hypothetical protein